MSFCPSASSMVLTCSAYGCPVDVCTQHTLYPLQLKGSEENLTLVVSLGSGQYRFCVTSE